MSVAAGVSADLAHALLAEYAAGYHMLSKRCKSYMQISFLQKQQVPYPVLLCVRYEITFLELLLTSIQIAAAEPKMNNMYKLIVILQL